MDDKLALPLLLRFDHSINIRKLRNENSLFVQVERWYQLPTSPSHGHGVVLLLTWTGCFVAENLAFLSMDNQQWWFHLDTYRHKMEFGCWVAR